MGKITCFLCGGVHIYPGPRFSNHLLHEHGVVFNQEYIVSVSQYKDSNATFPPLMPSTSRNQYSQTEALSNATCIKCATPIAGFETTAPELTKTIFSSPQNTSLLSSSSLFSTPKNNFLETCKIQQPLSDLTSVPERYGFIYNCALCSYVIKEYSAFRNHIIRKHGLDFKNYSEYHGGSETPIGTGKLECGLCHAKMKHEPNIVDKHLRGKHGVNWAQYVNMLQNNNVQGNEKIEGIEAVNDDYTCNISVDKKTIKREKIDITNVSDEPTTEIHESQYSMRLDTQCPTLEESPTLKADSNYIKNSDDELRLNYFDDLAKKQAYGAPEEKLRSLLNPLNTDTKPLNIKDKANKNCSMCDISFTSRILFLRHCQDVHKLRFKNKLGNSLFLSKNTLDVGEEQMKVGSNSSNYLGFQSLNFNSSPNIQLQTPPLSSLHPMPVHTCQYCNKNFSNKHNKERHEKKVCTLKVTVKSEEVMNVKDNHDDGVGDS